MAERKPLVLDGGQLEQLQPGDELEIPLEARFQALQRRHRLLILFLVEQGFKDIPNELLEDAVLLDK